MSQLSHLTTRWKLGQNVMINSDISIVSESLHVSVDKSCIVKDLSRSFRSATPVYSHFPPKFFPHLYRFDIRYESETNHYTFLCFRILSNFAKTKELSIKETTMSYGRNERDPLVRVTYGSYEPNTIYNYSNAINLSASTLTGYSDSIFDPNNNNNNVKTPDMVLTSVSCFRYFFPTTLQILTKLFVTEQKGEDHVSRTH